MLQPLVERTAEEYAAFLLPHLKPGMNILDCGYGPGTISVGLAQRITPGRLTGIDLYLEHAKLAHEHAVANGVTNVSFENGDVCAIPFKNGTFDVVFMHTLLVHLPEPTKALNEAKRVLKPGGIIAVRDVYLPGVIHLPHNPVIKHTFEIFEAFACLKGGDANIGIRYIDIFDEVGFIENLISTSFELVNTKKRIETAIKIIVDFCLNEHLRTLLIETGIVTGKSIDEIINFYNKHSDKIKHISVPYIEAIGWKK